MRRALEPMWWIAALAVAALVVWRIRRRRAVLLGRVSPRLVRMVVVILAFLGVGCERKPVARPATPAVAPAPAPAAVVVVPPFPGLDAIERWLEHRDVRSAWSGFKLEATRAHLAGAPLPASPFTARLASATTAAAALAALDALEAEGIFDAWLAGSLWRSALPPTVELYARLDHHARVADALLRARGEPGSIDAQPTVWRSKAAPPKGYRSRTASEVADRARELYAAADPTTWHTDGAVELAVAAGSPAPTVSAAGRAAVPAARFRVGRLTLIATGAAPVELVHARFGALHLAANRTYSVWELPETVAADRLRPTLDAALAGDEAAALELERALPLVHRALRAALVAQPRAAGAPRLRTILALFDDLPLPAPP